MRDYYVALKALRTMAGRNVFPYIFIRELPLDLS